MYGNVEMRSEEDPNVSALIPAATVVLVRDGDSAVEVLMLRKNSKITFGGMWVFPGGKIDAADYPGGEVSSDNIDAAARAAAVRETQEEAGITVDAQDYEFLSHWTPPPGQQKRFATWFFCRQG
jgi:8-oxo-dGTP pyrophosphatase MutT (NUDIX family)